MTISISVIAICLCYRVLVHHFILPSFLRPDLFAANFDTQDYSVSFYERNCCSPKGEAWAAIIKFASLPNTSIAGLPDFSKTKALSSVLLFNYLTASTMKFSYSCAVEYY